MIASMFASDDICLSGISSSCDWYHVTQPYPAILIHLPATSQLRYCTTNSQQRPTISDSLEYPVARGDLRRLPMFGIFAYPSMLNDCHPRACSLRLHCSLGPWFPVLLASWLGVVNGLLSTSYPHASSYPLHFFLSPRRSASERHYQVTT
jgi:hypothetical protein